MPMGNGCCQNQPKRKGKRARGRCAAARIAMPSPRRHYPFILLDRAHEIASTNAEIVCSHLDAVDVVQASVQRLACARVAAAHEQRTTPPTSVAWRRRVRGWRHVGRRRRRGGPLLRVGGWLAIGVWIWLRLAGRRRGWGRVSAVACRCGCGCRWRRARRAEGSVRGGADGGVGGGRPSCRGGARRASRVAGSHRLGWRRGRERGVPAGRSCSRGGWSRSGRRWRRTVRCGRRRRCDA
jgi:hypothetical protein